MSFSTALRFYIVLLFIAVFALIISMPAQVRFDFGRKNVCRFFPVSVRPTCTAVYRLPDSMPLGITRPSLTISTFGISFSRSLEFSYGLDINGGSEVILVADMSNIASPDRMRALDAAREVIARRVNLFGLSESSVTTARAANSYRLIASIPGVTQSDQITAIIGTTAQLDFREYQPAHSASSSARAGGPPVATGSVQKGKGASASATARSAGSEPASPSGMLVKDFVPTNLTGKDLVRASVVIDETNARPAITLEFSEEGTKKLAEITKRNIGKPIAIFLDEYPISAPRVDVPITDGRAQISGDFSAEDAKSLATTLNAGSLPVPISILSVRTVEPSLGKLSIQRSLRAGMIGVGLVIIFLIALYGLKGVIGTVSLLYYALLTVALYKLIPVTLSLSGIAGFLLSVGMSVDTIILVFERLREEEAEGAGTPARILSRSFSRAWGSIKDANIVTLITAFLLANPFGWSFLNTSGTVRGFALTLALGILLNLFTGMLVLRVLMVMFYRKRG